MLLKKLTSLAIEGEPVNQLDKILKEQQGYIDSNKTMLENFNNMSLMSKIKDNIGQLKEDIVHLNNTLTNIGDALNKIMHPSLILKDIWTFTVNNCYWICLVLCVGGLIYWIVCGSKKGAIVSKASLVTYIIIKAISVI